MELIGLRPKSRFSDVDDARVIRQALVAARGVETPLPVYSGRKKLGYTVGQRFSPYTYWLGFNNIDTWIDDVTNNLKYTSSRCDKASNAAPASNTWYDMWPVGPNPQPGGYAGAASTAVVYTDSTDGAMWHGGNVSPDTKRITGATLHLVSATAGIYILYDRVLGYENCPIAAGSTSMTNNVSAPRYNSGAPGLNITVISQTALGGATNLTALSYTNQDGTASRAVPGTYALSVGQTPSTTQAAQVILPSSIPFLPMQAGDDGARSIQSYTTSAAVTGALQFLLLRPIAYLGSGPVNAVPVQYNLMTQIAQMERVYDGACLSLLFSCQTTTSPCTIQCSFDFAW
jgi:hypothetical protein